MGKKQESSVILKGTLDMMILRTLIAWRCTRSHDRQGHRANIGRRTGYRAGVIVFRPASSGTPWMGVLVLGSEENNRKAKFYKLTVGGRKRLTLETSRWRQMARAIGLVMGESPAPKGNK